MTLFSSGPLTSTGRKTRKPDWLTPTQPTSAPAFFQARTTSFGRLGQSVFAGGAPATPRRPHVASMTSRARPRMVPFHVELLGFMTDLQGQYAAAFCCGVVFSSRNRARLGA